VRPRAKTDDGEQNLYERRRLAAFKLRRLAARELGQTLLRAGWGLAAAVMQFEPTLVPAEGMGCAIDERFTATADALAADLALLPVGVPAGRLLPAAEAYRALCRAMVLGTAYQPGPPVAYTRAAMEARLATMRASLAEMRTAIGATRTRARKKQ
jgi:hypothetical protein